MSLHRHFKKQHPNGTHEADCPQIHWRKGAAQGPGHDGSTPFIAWNRGDEEAASI
jgi:hypothetical protein